MATIWLANETGEFPWGSGWVYRRDDSTALLVTNWHVVENATVENTTAIDVQFDRGEWRTGTVVGVEPITDLAVVAVSNPPSTPIRYASPTRRRLPDRR